RRRSTSGGKWDGFFNPSAIISHTEERCQTSPRGRCKNFSVPCLHTPILDGLKPPSHFPPPPILSTASSNEYDLCRMKFPVALAFCAFAASAAAQDPALERMKFNHPGLAVDLGVGLWSAPIPCDADGDGDFDLVVVCHDKPFNGTYLFENTTGDTAKN